MRNKKKWKQLIALAMSAVMLIPAQVGYAAGGGADSDIEVYAENREADANGFVIEDGVLTGYTGTATEVVIPDNVTSIGVEAFRNCGGLTSITIPSSVTSIGMWAFYKCSSLTSITIPSSVTTIGDSAFYDCSGLTSIKVEEGNPKYDSRENCNALIETESNTLIRGCKNTTIPTRVTHIGEVAFSGCNGLTSLTLPSGVTNIGRSAFIGCSGLTSIKVEKGNLTYDSREDCNAIIYTEGDRLVLGCKNTVIPKDVKSIGEAAFAGCSGLESITIPSSVTIIEMYAFNDCIGLRNVTIPASVTSIIDRIFLRCSEALTIYGTAGSYAETYAQAYNIKFSTGTPSQTEQLTEKKTISSGNVTIKPVSYAYDGKAKKPTVTVKVENTTLKAGTDYTVEYKNNTNAGTAAVTVTGKGDYKGAVTKTFTITVKKNTSHKAGAYQYKVTGTSTVSVTAINDKKATKVKVPNTVKIGGKTFKVTAIANNAFKKNTKITSIEIGDNVKTIGTSAFEGCTKLTKVTVGKGVTEVGSNAFKNCKKLGTITIKSTSLKKVGKNALKGIKAAAKVKVPVKKLSAYKKIFKNKGQGKKVKITK